jgi:hypothetical protein
MILHAAGVVHNARSHVFVGPSGAGKTTIARAAGDRGWGILADDGLIVRRMPDGGFRAFRTPWRMSLPTGEQSQGEQLDSAGLSTLFFIEHGTRERWTRLTPLEAVAMLAGNSMGPLRQYDGAGHADTIFDLLGQLGSQVPSYHLCFSPACEFLAAIDEVEGIRKGGKSDEELYL